jgi:hypoxanthine-guanine phosphoribosyltransferase
MKRIILSEQEIDKICQRVAKEIDEKIENEEKIPLLVGVMNGALNFMMSLMKYIKHPIFTDYIRISSYF